MPSLDIPRLLQGLGELLPNQSGTLVGVPPGAQALVLAALARRTESPALCLVETTSEAERLVDDLQTYLAFEPERSVARLYPESEMSLFDQGHADPERLRVLHELHRGRAVLVVAPLLALLQSAPAPKRLRRRHLEVGADLDLAQLVELLVGWEYEVSDVVRHPGQLSPRNQLLDIFPSTGDPVRLKTCEGRLVELSRLNLEDQRSLQPLEKLELLPMVEPAGQESLLDYVPETSPVMLLEADKLRGSLEEMARRSATGKRYSSYEDIEILQDDNPDDWAQLEHSIQPRQSWKLQAEGEGLFSELPSFDSMSDFVDWAQGRPGDLPLVVVTQHPKRLKQRLSRQGLKTATVVRGSLSQGVRIEGLADLITDRELFGVVARYRPRRALASGPDLEGITEGDLVVHAQRGIGRFFGLVPVELTGIRQDMVRLQYANDGVLMVPPEQMRELTVYRGPEDHEPALSRLDTSAWSKTLSQTLESVLKSAKALKSAHTRRSKKKAPSIGPDRPEQDDLEDSFPYDETPSQLAAIAEIKADLEKPKAMDRLLCGDVGYGKTEVALRAAFKVLSHGFQVALLAPTTVLAQQHYDSFGQRMRPLGVEVLGLWSDAEDQDSALQHLAEGSPAMVIGTHRLLSDEVTFPNLGLLIVDEEQSFGVAHKEKLRKLAQGVHLLCMSATPIPRTMQLALAGVRDISLLDSPPRARRAIRTYLLDDQKKYWEAALTRELERGGQAFVLHNRIEELEELSSELQSLLPGSKVAVAHGKLSSSELDTVLGEFANRDHDILVCSTIIEAGIDLPNVNTMVVKDAHLFGLAQLYQIRGRVGRSDQQAYCYLMVPKGETLTGKAKARLKTISELTELGSGFAVAQRDLEIRGAGDLLGADQTGQMNRVGYRLYAELLAAALEPKRRATKEPERLSMDLRWDAYLPAEYIEPTSLRFSFYSRLARLESEEEIASFQDELGDRFGDPPAPVKTLLDLARLRLRAAAGGLTKIAVEEHLGERTLGLWRGKKTETVPDPPNHQELLGFLLEHLRPGAGGG